MPLPSPRDNETVTTYSRSLRAALDDLHDEPLSKEQARKVIHILLDQQPAARAAYRRLEGSPLRFLTAH